MRRAIANSIVRLCLGLGLAACGGDDQSATVSEQPALELATVTVASREVTGVHRVSGEVRTRDQVMLTAKVAGYVARVLVAAGDEVEAGAVLLELHAAELDAALRAARSAIEGADAALAEADAGLAAARAGATLAEATWSRYQTLIERKAATAQEIDEVMAGRTAATAALTAAAARRAQSVAGTESARAALAAAASMNSYARITAPFRARVLARRVDPGAFASPGFPLLELGSVGPARVVAWVEESMGAALAVGSVAQIAIGDALPAAAHVVEIEPRVDAGSRSFKIELELDDDANASLRPGAFARVALEAGKRVRVLVPRTAIRPRGQLDRLFVVEDGRATMRIVTLGDPYGDEVEVLSGAGAGDIVVRDPTRELRDGRRVESR